jgi:hypothetical protein
LTLLIFADWLPPDFCASRSCLALDTDIAAEAAALNDLEDAPPSHRAAEPIDDDHVLSCADGYRGVGDTSCAIAQTNPESSRAMAVAAFGLAFPRATRRRKRVVSRSWAFHAMSHTTFGKASCR